MENQRKENTYLKEVGERLRQCRTKNSVSRKEQAYRADVPVTTVAQMEKGEKSVDIESVVKICEVLNCSVDFMLTGKCGITELIHLNQRFLNIQNLPIENIKKFAHAFWCSCPKMHI